MSSAVRLRVFLVAGTGLLAFLLWSYTGLPDFGHYLGPYGDILVRLSIPERSTTAVVSAINFDFRGFDTLGEEFILFAAVVGVASLLRNLRGERDERPDDDAKGRRVRETSVAVSVVGLALVGPTLLVGLYVVIHGHQTPGGGFQGGVILATAPLAVYLAAEARTFQRIAPKTLVELTESAGAAGYVVLGLVGLALGATFLGNVLPLGRAGEVNGAGNIQALNLIVGIEVAGGFVVLLGAFIEEALRRTLRRQAR